MFKCYVTGRVSKAGEKPEQVIIEKREKTYYSAEEPTKAIAVGWEIGKVVLMSKDGFEQWKQKNGL